jgi:hypothetical protein
MQIVPLIAVISVILSCTILVYTVLTDSRDGAKGLHTTHLQNFQDLEPTNLEHRLDLESASDASSGVKVIIDKEYVDSTINCEFCTRIEFSSTHNGTVGLAYKNDNNDINLTGSKRLVFFARAGSSLNASFLAVGTNDGAGFKNTESKNVFPNKNFAVITKKVILNNDWKRFEVNLGNASLKGVSVPFGFMTSDYVPYTKQVLYVKGITFDQKKAENPIPSFFERR